jgi:hypothetical protein
MFMRLPAVLFLFFLALPARAETQHLVYSLQVDEQSVGHREVSIRYLVGDRGEVRLLESYTEFRVALPGQDLEVKQRLSGMGGQGRGDFSCAMSQNGEAREVQVSKQPGGWIVTLAELGRARSWELEAGAFDATSLSLVDPGALSLEGRSHLRILAAETGAVLEGTLSEGGSRSVFLGDSVVEGIVYDWETADGSVQLVYEPGGVLLEYSMPVGVGVLRARLESMPAPRSYGDTVLTPIVEQTIGEEAL